MDSRGAPHSFEMPQQLEGRCALPVRLSAARKDKAASYRDIEPAIFRRLRGPAAGALKYRGTLDAVAGKPWRDYGYTTDQLYRMEIRWRRFAQPIERNTRIRVPVEDRSDRRKDRARRARRARPGYFPQVPHRVTAGRRRALLGWRAVRGMSRSCNTVRSYEHARRDRAGDQGFRTASGGSALSQH